MVTEADRETSRPDLPAELGARFQAAHARGRTAEVLLGLALDVLEPYASDYLSADEYRELCDLVEGPVDAASRAALATLERELARAHAQGHPLLVARFDHRAQIIEVD